jgi:ubiquinone/menaquinone biosynthesis C-methylase UbiE
LGRFVDSVEWRALLDLLRPEPAEHILDIGSGTGINVRRLARLSVHAVGLEPSAAMLAEAQRNTAAQPHWYVRGVAEALPFAGDVFDAALFVTTLEFVADVNAAVAEAARVVRSGGRIVAGVLNSRGPWAAARRSRRGGQLWESARFFARDEIEALLAQFGSVEVRLGVYVPPGVGWMPPGILPVAEWLGRQWAPSAGAFIAARVEIRR